MKKVNAKILHSCRNLDKKQEKLKKVTAIKEEVESSTKAHEHFVTFDKSGTAHFNS